MHIQPPEIMSKQIFQDLLAQNQVSLSHTFKKINSENISYRLSPEAASVGFIYRHIGEIMHLLGQFLGQATDVKNTTMGFQDEGQGLDLETSQKLITSGFGVLQKIIETNSEVDWATLVETPFFGTLSKARLFAHILYHNSYHTGQIALTLKRGSL